MIYAVTGFTVSGNFSIPLTKEQFEEIKAAKETYLFAWALEEKLALLLDNFYEFEVEMLKLAESSILWPSAEDFEKNDAGTFKFRSANSECVDGLSALFGSNRQRNFGYMRRH